MLNNRFLKHDKVAKAAKLVMFLIMIKIVCSNPIDVSNVERLASFWAKSDQLLVDCATKGKPVGYHLVKSYI